MNVLRATIVVFSVIAVALTLYFPTVLQLQLTAYTMYGAAITPAILFALFSKKVTPAGGMAGIIVGGAMTIIWYPDGHSLWYSVRHRGCSRFRDRHPDCLRADCRTRRRCTFSGSLVQVIIKPDGAEGNLCPRLSSIRFERRNDMEDPRIRKFAKFFDQQCRRPAKG